MKAISLWQPWASLIASKDKPFETRSFAPPRTSIGQYIAIHAAKRVDKDAAALATDIVYGQHRPGGFEQAERLAATYDRHSNYWVNFGQAAMPAGCIVAIVKLTAAYQCGDRIDPAPESGPAAKVWQSITSPGNEPLKAVPIDDWGNYAPGRWAWHLTDVRVLNPAPPMKGMQGWFDLPQGWMTEAAA